LYIRPANLADQETDQPKCHRLTLYKNLCELYDNHLGRAEQWGRKRDKNDLELAQSFTEVQDVYETLTHSLQCTASVRGMKKT